MLLSANNITKIYNGSPVLKNVNLVIQDNDKIGLIGNNGCGKSTLLRIITGLEIQDSGDVSMTATVGFLAQSGTDSGKIHENITVFEEMQSVFSHLSEVYKQIKELEHELSDKEKARKYAQLSSYFEANDGYNIDIKIKTVLSGMGFKETDWTRGVTTFSGGEQTRLSISKLLLEEPNLLILDEPTNHLDFKTIAWLEDYLKTYRGALLIVSHDRYFLDRLCTSICEIEYTELIRYKGNYSAYVGLKEELVARRIKEYEAQQREIEKMQDYVARNIARDSTSKSAKSRVKALERMDVLDKPHFYHKSAKMEFRYTITPPLDVLKVKEIDIIAGEKVLAENVSFEVRRGDRLAIIGENGTGKSTLLKMLVSGKSTKGRVFWNENIKISYYEQENTILNPHNTVFNEIHDKFPLMNDLEIRSILGQLRITGENVFKEVGVISGGERAKVRFAVMMLRQGNILILDEPTNHLDLSTKEVLETALLNFDGTVIFVSHDRYLLNKVATRILEISDKNVNQYNGNFDFYQKQISEKNVEIQQTSKPQTVPRGKDDRVAKANKRLKIRELELEIDDLQEKLSALQEDIIKPEVFNDFRVMNEKCSLIEEYKQKIDLDIEELILLE